MWTWLSSMLCILSSAGCSSIDPQCNLSWIQGRRSVGHHGATSGSISGPIRIGTGRSIIHRPSSLPPYLNMSRKALVTGCSSGIGRATAIALYHGGWDVAICGRRGDALAETEALMRMDAGAPTRQIVSLVVDLQDESQVASMFEKVKEEFGTLTLQ